MPNVGEQITAPTAANGLVTGEVTAIYTTNAEGLPLHAGPTLLVRDANGHEHAVKLGAHEQHQRDRKD